MTQLFLNFRKTLLVAGRIHRGAPTQGQGAPSLGRHEAGTGAMVTGMAWREGASVGTSLAQRGPGVAVSAHMGLGPLGWLPPATHAGLRAASLSDAAEARMTGGTEKATVLS